MIGNKKEWIERGISVDKGDSQSPLKRFSAKIRDDNRWETYKPLG